MTKQQCLKRLRPLLKDLREDILQRIEYLLSQGTNYGMIDLEAYDADYELPKAILYKATKDVMETLRPAYLKTKPI